MCALVQAIRKVGIVAAGPGYGDPTNPMHIVQATAAEVPRSTDRKPTGRPDTSSSHDEFVDDSAGAKRRVAEDPTTQVDDRPAQTAAQQFAYYAEENLDRQMSGTSGVSGRHLSPADVERGRSFGRRRKATGDLEKGEAAPR